MPPEPPVKRAVAFIDGQNLFHAAKEAFGYRWPNFDPLKLSTEVCRLEAAAELRTIAREQERWLKVASSYPSSAASRNRRGINKTDWVPIERAMFDRCIDPRDYRPKVKP